MDAVQTISPLMNTHAKSHAQYLISHDFNFINKQKMKKVQQRLYQFGQRIEYRLYLHYLLRNLKKENVILKVHDK